MDLGLILGIIFLAVDVVISIWNSYNAGEISRSRKGLGITFYTLGGFLPMSYVLAIVLTLVLAYLGYLSLSTSIFLLSFSYLVFGLEIIIWGIIATVSSLITTMGTRSWKAGIITAYDAFATIFDAWEYITTFFSNVRSARKAIDSSDFSIIDVLLILITALGAAFIITYAAYKEGYKARLRYW
ncbi:hypothetical protein [Candidatus Acidianus copahuensis]|uniref:hypothetical protein n=1 Tax=Candidatus Acidianus copahuensis TaxID=1160895 RepID=UPI00064E3072|nr:hypothetical protein [Candidatus Acidianus copahuensis]